MYASRRYSVKRHIQNIHGGGNANLISYTDYLIGRKSGIYLPGIPPMYIPKNKDEENNSRPHYMDIFKDELFRCTIRKSFEINQNKNKNLQGFWKNISDV
jgi:hypothetical protein